MFTFCKKKKLDNSLVFQHQMMIPRKEEVIGGEFQNGTPYIGAVTSSMIDASTAIRGQGRQFGHCQGDNDDTHLVGDYRVAMEAKRSWVNDEGAAVFEENVGMGGVGDEGMRTNVGRLRL